MNNLLKLRLFVGGVLLYILASGLSAAERTWYWHYTPLANENSQALGVSTQHGDRVGPLQVRVLAGYELESLGVNVQWQVQPNARHSQWYLATGLTAQQDFRRDFDDNCLLLSCDRHGGSVRTYSRWTWLKLIGDFRVDVGYGVEVLWYAEYDSRVNPRLNPAFDFTLGWSLF